MRLEIAMRGVIVDADTLPLDKLVCSHRVATLETDVERLLEEPLEPVDISALMEDQTIFG